MKTLQNCVMRYKPQFDAEDKCVWFFEFDDNSSMAVREANVVTSPGFVYRASSDGTLTPLKSTIRKNRNNLPLVAQNFPEVGKIDIADLIDYGTIGWDYAEDRPISYRLLINRIGEI